MRHLAAIATALTTTYVATGTHADDPTVRLQLRVPEPGYSLSVRRDYGRHDEPTRPFACGPRCVMDVPPGRYRIELFDAQRRYLGTTFVDADEDAIWHVLPPDPTTRNVGLALGITGSALVTTGLLVLGSNVDSGSGGAASDPRETHPWRVAAVLGLFVGAIITPLGWIAYGRNRHPIVEKQETSPSALSGLRLGVAPLPGGAAFGAGFAF